MQLFISLLLVTLTYMVGGVTGLAFKYHNNTEMTQYMTTTSQTYPAITHLYNIGKSEKGTELCVLAIGKDIKKYVPLRPTIKFIANIHGNEVVGREILLHLIDLYVTSYSTNTTISKFLDTTAVHIMPSMNPDGYDKASLTECTNTIGKVNAKGFNLDHNFPDLLRNTHTGPRSKETQAVMDWSLTHNFALSASLHGNALVAVYPYHQYTNAMKQSRLGPSPTSDNDVLHHLARSYATLHPYMSAANGTMDGTSQSKLCNATTKHFPDGSINGADWYPIAGTMQDYNYVAHGTLELNLEISCCHAPSIANLRTHWLNNHIALQRFAYKVHMGVKGFVRDGKKQIIKGVQLTVKGRELAKFRTSAKGEYFRLLFPGTYTLQASHTGYLSMSTKFTVTEGEVTRHDVILQSGATSIGCLLLLIIAGCSGALTI